MVASLQGECVKLPPLKIRFLRLQPETWFGRYLDALIEVSWGKRRAQFMVEMKSQSTPKAFQDAVGIVKAAAAKEKSNRLPMVMLPYLNEAQLKELEQEKISGIDLCGNGVVTVPDEFAVFRSVGENRFSSSAPIKNIYRRNSSMVGRVFLACPRFTAVKEVVSEIARRNLLVTRWRKSPVTFATVSKVLAGMQEDLIISRSKGQIRLLQPDKLLEKLVESYTGPKATGSVRLRITLDTSAVIKFLIKDPYRQKVFDASAVVELLMKESEALQLPIVATGLSSVSQYAVMQRGEILSVYCPESEKLLAKLPKANSDRFPNLEIIEMQDETAYFDARQERGFWWASPVQAYLELMAGDKRDQETAVQVRNRILRDAEAQRL